MRRLLLLAAPQRRGESARVDQRPAARVALAAARTEDRRVTAEPFHYEDRQTHRVYASSRDQLAEEWSTRFDARGVVAARRVGRALADAVGFALFSLSVKLFGGEAAAERASAESILEMSLR